MIGGGLSRTSGDKPQRGDMSMLACRVAALILFVCCTQTIAAGQPAGSAPTVAGGWGFDFNGADFANNPGDDFFRYGDGAWHDRAVIPPDRSRSEEHTSELQSHLNLVCRLLLEKKNVNSSSKTA